MVQMESQRAQKQKNQLRLIFSDHSAEPVKLVENWRKNVKNIFLEI